MMPPSKPEIRPLRVLIVDDQKLVRASLKTTLARHGAPAITLAGEAEEGREAVTLCARLKPDIILMDIGMPILDGIRATRAIRQHHAEVGIIMLTSHESDEDILDAFRAGANAYCLKDAPPETLITVIQRTAAGERWVDPKIAGVLIRHSLAGASPPPSRPPEDPEDASAFELLTEREIDVLRLIAVGKANAEIADTLVLSLNTIKTHLKSIYQKLGVEDRTGAALKAIRERII